MPMAALPMPPKAEHYSHERDDQEAHSPTYHGLASLKNRLLRWVFQQFHGFLISRAYVRPHRHFLSF
jgi:hypothetical protein